MYTISSDIYMILLNLLIAVLIQAHMEYGLVIYIFIYISDLWLYETKSTFLEGSVVLYFSFICVIVFILVRISTHSLFVYLCLYVY